MIERLGRRAPMVIALALVLGLAGCGGIPTSGPVQAGQKFDTGTSTDFVFRGFGPEKGASQQQILEGFVKAFSGPQGDYLVARKFLSSSFAKEWDPRKSVFIRTGPPSYTPVDSVTMDYTFTTAAQVDEFGAYTGTVPGQQTLSFGFVKEKDQWRISQAPPGIVLAESTFHNVFSKHALYFYDLSLHYLVPDQRWFPGGTTATRIVSALLVGPPEWLKGAVVSQFPDGTQLSPGTTVTIDSTVAQVDLTSEAASANERQRQLMRLQLSQSLSTVPGIGSVDVSAAGSLLSIPPLGSDSPESPPGVDSRPLVLATDGFGYYSGGDTAPIEQLSDKVVKLAPLAVTLGSSGTVAAVQAADGVYVVRTGQIPARKLDERRGLIAPSLDDYGYIWSVPASQPGAIIAYDFDGVPHKVTVAAPAGARIVSLEVARDNSRIAMLLQTDSGPHLMIAAIIRDAGEKYVPLSLGTPVLDTVIDATTAIDLAWVDAFSVATLTEENGLDQVAAFDVGGLQSSLGRPDASVAIVGGNSGKSGLRLLGADQLLRVPRGSGWQKTTIKVDLIATQR